MSAVAETAAPVEADRPLGIPCTTTVVVTHNPEGAALEDDPVILWAQVEFMHHEGGYATAEAVAVLQAAHEANDAAAGMLLGYDIRYYEWSSADTTTVLLGHGLAQLR
jgi:hypothetical protein